MLSSMTSPIWFRKSVRQPATVATTVPCHSVPCISNAFLPSQPGFFCATAANFWPTPSTSDFIWSAWNTAWPIVVAWSFHGSKNASPSPCGMVGAIADSFW